MIELTLMLCIWSIWGRGRRVGALLLLVFFGGIGLVVALRDVSPVSSLLHVEPEACT